MEQGSQDRNLPASQRKLKKARDEGRVSRSEDLSHLAILGVGGLALLVLIPVYFNHTLVDTVRQLTFDASTIKQSGTMFTRLSDATTLGITCCVTFAALTITAVVIAAVASGGWVQSLTPLMPDFGRVNPFAGLSNMLTKKKFITTGKMLLLTTILFTVAGLFLSNGIQTVVSLVMQPSSSTIAQLVRWITQGVGLMLLVLLFAALVDVPLQLFLFKGELKMSFQEMKEEGKDSDGNPQIKSKIRQKQRELAQRSSVNNVPKADFVVMNPTHFAVAIKYDDKTMRAPQVISKGADLLALKIRDLAKNHAIPVLQSPMLARALYANAELEQDIPTALYTAVAQVLAYVYRLRAALKGEGPMPSEVPQPVVPPELDPLWAASSPNKSASKSTNNSSNNAKAAA